MNPSVGGLTHAVDFTDAFNLANTADMATLFATGQFFAQAFDAEGSSLMSSLIDQSNISVSVAATDTAGNTDAVAPSDVAFLDTTADVEGDLSVSVDSVINDAESGTVQIAISGIDADVASPGSVVVSVGDSSARAEEIASAQKTKDDAASDLASLKAQLAPLVAIVGLEQLGLSELNSALGAAESRVSARQGDKESAETDYNTAYGEARAAFVGGTADPDTLSDGDPVTAPIVSPSLTITGDDIEGGAVWTEAQINLLAADMDSFIGSYTWPDPQGQTVDQLEGALDDAIALLGAAQQQVAEITGDRDAQQGVVDTAAGAVNSKQGDIDAKQNELDTASETLDTLLGQDLTGITATYVSGNIWEADVSGLDDGSFVVNATVTDNVGNSASASNSFTLDTSADLDELFTVSVAADDAVTNAAESTNVSLSLSGIDADASSVSVAITDGETTVTADATNDGSGWVVADQDLSGLADGTLTVTASVTDAAGNSADAVSDSLTLDTTADA